MTTSPSIEITDSAASKIYALIQEEGNPNLKLRVYVEGGGCSGFTYGFTFEENIDENDDVLITKQIADGKIQVAIHYLSFTYLQGATINYKQGLEGEYFEILTNPNAKTTCGCGSSFSA